MPDTAARNARSVRWGEVQSRKREGGVFTRCRDELWSTKQDEAINSLLLFRLPAHTESLFHCVF